MSVVKGADPTRLEIFKSLFHSIAEEMGAALRRSAFSPNIKERRDYSCAVYDANGEVLAMGDHMPVHLGSMPMSVAAARAAFPLYPGDMAVLNDPFAGGTHLPDLTVVMPVYLPATKRPFFYVANRAHHADIGGALAGSMGPAREIYQEGLRIPPVKLYERGKRNESILRILLANVRTPSEREGDLSAQMAACRIGERRLLEILHKYGRAEVRKYCGHLLDYSEQMMGAAIEDLRNGQYQAEDFLDDDGIDNRPLRIAARIRVTGREAEVDFSGTAPQCAGNVNAVKAIAHSAVFYVFRCLLSEDVPATSGLMRPIGIVAPVGSLVNARPPAAVAGGNVETSQRIVDTLLRALAQAAPIRIPAASQGTMNNLTIGGLDPRHGNTPFAYYETTAGGMGARPGKDGLSGVHTHMTNSLNTPIEVLETAYPLRVRRYAVRRSSGGNGKFRGGDGIIREVEVLADSQVGFLCDRRSRGPYGLAGGKPGAPGSNSIRESGKWRKLAGKCSLLAAAGSVLRIETPGGGGWGRRVVRKREKGDV
jgi:N-methylhydantoinase B